ncbi:MAG: hypothetical protein AB1540_00315 [Bdellovibrionota bacterium]
MKSLYEKTKAQVGAHSLRRGKSIFSKDKDDALAETTRTDYVSALKKHTAPWWKRQAAEITRADVVEVLNQLKAHSSSISYQNKIKVIINRIFVFGIDNRLVGGMDRSPAHGISLGRDEEKKPEILTLGEIRKLLQEARRMNHEWYPVWSLARLTGMRSGELYALLWTDLDFENKVISVNNRSSIAPAVVMKICGWKDLETMQRYIRLAGIETQGATNVLKVLPEADVAAQVVNLFTRERIEQRPE